MKLLHAITLFATLGLALAKDFFQTLGIEATYPVIGALPFIVAFLVYLSSPNYIMPLFTTNVGNLILGVAGVWMSIGIFVMRKMMNFEV